MTAIRIMTYNIQRCRGSDGKIDPDRVKRVISDGAPDIVALQEIDCSDNGDQLRYLSLHLGMRCYGTPRSGGNAFLSYYPLSGIRDYELGSGGCCMRADADIPGQRLHLFNLRLDSSPARRRLQISELLGSELLGSDSVICPTLVIGDFADLWWGAGNVSLNMVLRRARRPLWSGTYPAFFPFSGRDRAYLKGDIRVIDSAILRSSTARRASSHLPLILTLQVSDPRNYLRVEKLKRNRMEIAPG